MITQSKTTMRILIVSTSERTGGAAVAAERLMNALNNNGEKAKMMVRDKTTDSVTVVPLRSRRATKWHFLWERLRIFLALRLSKKRLFEIDIANCGTDITRTKEFLEADVVHLHWVNQGMLSLGGIKKITESGKGVVWTMHDMWPAVGICHYARGCEKFRSGCRCCPLLPGGGDNGDLSARVTRRKAAIYGKGVVQFVACSRWLESQAKQSALLADQYVTTIPNAIDTHVFAPKDKNEARRKAALPADKTVILFVSQRVTDPRKGISHFVEALNILLKRRPESADDTVVAVLGGRSDGVESLLPLPTVPLGYVSEPRRIADIYSAADVFVLPSLEDNLPNTIMEAMACGVPCVAFRVGGIPEMVDDGVNGYLAEPCNDAMLAEGIRHAAYDADRERLSHEAVTKVRRDYSQHAVARRYLEVYERAAREARKRRL